MNQLRPTVNQLQFLFEVPFELDWQSLSNAMTLKKVPRNRPIRLGPKQGAIVYHGAFKTIFQGNVYDFTGTKGILLSVDEAFLHTESREEFITLEDSILFVFDFPELERTIYNLSNGALFMSLLFKKYFIRKYYKERFYFMTPQERFLNFQNFIEVPMHLISQKDIAEYIGISPQSLSRLKRKMNDSNEATDILAI
ncbi:hypothetical protein N9N67_06510 [Bacteriovoracaceae bacterium]|nr:hypothetical protein [Bacteriovoracaceae bacterium]